MAQAVARKRPLSFYLCSITLAFERAAYYGARALILIYITTAVTTGGLGLEKADAAHARSWLVAATYLAPILLGFIADKYIGSRYLIPTGMVLMGVGYAYAGFVGGLTSIYIMIALVTLGTGFFKSNISALVGTLFEDPGEKDAAYSIMYSFINIGSFIGTTFLATIYGALAVNGQMGYLATFKVAGLVCIIGAVFFVLSWKALGDAGKYPFEVNKDKSEEKKDEVKRPLVAYEKRRVFSIFLISALSVVFWICWYLSSDLVMLYSQSYTDLHIFGSEFELAWFDSENAFLCIALGPILGALWLRLSRRPQGDMSLYKKLSLGLSLLGLSFLMLTGSELQRGVGAGEDAKASIFWMIAFILLLSLGEMVFSPLGYGFVSKYSPKRILSSMISVWVVATFVAGKAYPYIYEWIEAIGAFKASIIMSATVIGIAFLVLVFEKRLASLVELRDGEQLVEE